MANIIRIGGGGGSTPTLITKSITQNGIYNASSDNADGYSSVDVSVSGGGTAVTQFRYIKWHITANGGAGYFQVSELGFCDTADNIMAFPQGMSATSSLSLLSDYSISNLFDGSTNTKIVTEWHSGDIEDITIDFGSGNEIDITEYPYYYWGSSDDDQTYVGRAPLKWQLLGANQSDFSDAVLLDEVTSFSPLVKNKEMAYRGLMVSPIQSGGGSIFDNVPIHSGKINLNTGAVVADDDFYYTDMFNAPNGQMLFDLGEISQSNYIGVEMCGTSGSHINYWSANERYRNVSHAQYYAQAPKLRLSFRKIYLDEVVLIDKVNHITYSGKPTIIGDVGGGGIDYIESWIITNTSTTMSTHIEYTNNGQISSYAVYSQAGNTTQTEGDMAIRIGSDTNWKWSVTALDDMTYKIYDVVNGTLSELRTATNGTVILSNIEISGNITYEIRRYS